MDALPLVLFAATYVGLALGRVPGLALDRTGVALLGAVACLATGSIGLESAQRALDAPTLALLFGMMVLSAQYRIAGVYTVLGDRLARIGSPRRMLTGVLVLSALLASLLTNDIVCLALTPLLCQALLRARLDPVPYLVGLACATNIGSALTPVGNPQNILIAQTMELPFVPFVVACALPVALSLAFLYALLSRQAGRPVPESLHADIEPRVPYDGLQAAKAYVLTGALVVLFLSPVPAWLSALGVAGFALLNRRTTTRQMLGLVDWQMLTLFASLFVVLGTLEQSGWTARAERALLASGLDMDAPLLLVPVVALLSITVSNVAAVMLLLPFLTHGPATGHTVALASTLAGNAVLLGSIANLIVAEQAARQGVEISFRRHLRTGLPVALFSLLVVLLGALLAGG